MDQTHVVFEGRKLLFFGGCDYYRMSGHMAVRRAVIASSARNGLSVSASRLTTGDHPIYGTLEQALAKFFGVETATLVSNGYLSSTAACQAVAGKFSRALMDERSHAALRDAARFLDCPCGLFRHRDPASLAQALARIKEPRSVIVLTDGLFAHDGSVAPLREYRKVLPRSAWLLVDDAHGAGVLGRSGKGTPEHEAVGHARLIQAITLSKAFGSSGGAVLGPKALRTALFERSAVFGGSTPVPLPMAAAALAALRILEKGEHLAQLRMRTTWMKQRALAAGLPVANTPGPILALPPLSRPRTETLRRALLEAGIYPTAIRYLDRLRPPYYRFVISSEHALAHLRSLLDVLRRELA